MYLSIASVGHKEKRNRDDLCFLKPHSCVKYTTHTPVFYLDLNVNWIELWIKVWIDYFDNLQLFIVCNWACLKDNMDGLMSSNVIYKNIQRILGQASNYKKHTNNSRAYSRTMLSTKRQQLLLLVCFFVESVVWLKVLEFFVCFL